MTTPLRLSLLALAVFLAGCATSSTSSSKTVAEAPSITRSKPWTPSNVETTHRLLIGDWYGRQPAKEGGTVEWIMRRAADGTFRVTFRNFAPSGRLIDESNEVGDWGVNGNLILTHTIGWLKPDGTISPAPQGVPYFWDAYRILALTSDEIRYVSVESGNEYSVVRIATGAGFPSRSSTP